MYKGCVIACCPIPTVEELCVFLSEYAARLLGCGATCMRLERNVKRMASAFGMTAVMTIMPRHIHMTVANNDRTESFTYISAIPITGISFDINARLSELSWSVADGVTPFAEAREEFKEICTTKPANRWFVLFMASAANAAFCKIFSGDIYAMAIVFIATVVGFYLKQRLSAMKVDVRLVFIISAFVSSMIGALCGILHLGATPGIAVGTSVLYLVPGIPFLNSFSDMLAGHYICAFSRFMHAVILTASLSIGLCAGMAVMHIGMF